MALINNAPPPLGDAIANPLRAKEGYKPGTDPQEGMCSQPWGDWFTNLLSNQEKASGRIATVEVREASGDITTTEIATTEPLTAGLYEIKYYLRLQRVDGISSNVTVTFFWVWDATARQFSGTTLAANNLVETVSDPILIAIDNNTTISYQTNTSFGAADGLYALDIVLFEVDA